MARGKKAVQVNPLTKKKARRTKEEVAAGLTLEQKRKGITVADIQSKNSRSIIAEKSKKAKFQINGKAIYVAKGPRCGLIFDIVDVYGKDADGNPTMLILKKIENPEKTFDAGIDNFRPYNEGKDK